MFYCPTSPFRGAHRAEPAVPKAVTGVCAYCGLDILRDPSKGSRWRSRRNEREIVGADSGVQNLMGGARTPPSSPSDADARRHVASTVPSRLTRYGHYDPVTEAWSTDVVSGFLLCYAFAYEATAALRDYPTGHRYIVREIPASSPSQLCEAF